MSASFSLLSKQESVNYSTDSKLRGHIYLMIKALGESLVTRQWREYKGGQVQGRQARQNSANYSAIEQ